MERRTPARWATSPPLPLLPLLPLQQACSQPKAAAGWYYILYTSNAQLTLMLKAWMGGSFEKICITVSFELGIIRITGACHLLCCVAFDLLFCLPSESVQHFVGTLESYSCQRNWDLGRGHCYWNWLLQLLLTRWQQQLLLLGTCIVLQVFSNYFPLGFCKF